MQKAAVYDALCRLDNHPTAEQVYAEVRCACPRISRGTVYRVLNHMAEQGTVGKLCFSDRAIHYDARSQRHYHVFCTRCGQISDIELPAVEEMLSGVKAAGYEISGHSLIFSGICPECRIKEESYGQQSLL